MPQEYLQYQYLKTKIGELILGSCDDKLYLLDFRYRRMRSTVDSRIQKGLEVEFRQEDNPLLQSTRKQVQAYLEGEIREFDLPIGTVGTDFQKQVWGALARIPYGETTSYIDLATSMGNPQAVRALAAANGANALALIIPCHRVIGKNGSLIGYGGGLTAKKRLLKLERETDNKPRQLSLFD